MSYRVGQSNISGRGTFATKDIPRYEYVGIAMIKIRETGIPDDDFRRSELGKFTNHSTSPNLYVKRNKCCYEFFAKRSIKKGEELTVNYHTFDFEGKRDF